MKRAGEEAEEENIRKRTKKAGACQVKDVSRVSYVVTYVRFLLWPTGKQV